MTAKNDPTENYDAKLCSSSLERFEAWARKNLDNLGTKHQQEWVTDKYVLNALIILPGLIAKYNEFESASKNE